MKAFDGKTGLRLAWGVSLVLWLLLLVGAFTYQREELRLLPGEATVLMQAQSLVEDGDLRYERIDFDRVLLQIAEPPDVELTSGTGGRSVTFDRPFPYALWLAPFVAVFSDMHSPAAGFAVANALLLGASALFAAWALARRTGPFGAVWIAALVFATPILTSVFRVDGDAYLLAAVFAAVGFALQSGEVAGEQYRGPSSRLALASGVCLALAGAWEPIWLVVPLAFLLLWRQGAQRGAMALGWVVGTLPQMLVQWWVGGGLHFFGGVPGKFTTASGFPYVDFLPVNSGVMEWNSTVQRLSALHFDGAPVLSWGFDVGLWLWNGLYLLMGRHMGLIPYAAVVLVAFAAMPGRPRKGYDEPRRGLRTWLVAVGLAVVLLLVLRPFQLFDAAALGPTALLPLLALTPLVRATSPVGTRVRGDAVLALIVCLALSVPALLPMWMSPRATTEDRLEPSRLVSFLPYEVSQQDLPGGPWEDVAGLRVRFLDGHGWAESRRERLVMEGDQTARMLFVSSVPLDGLVLDFGDDASTRLQVEGGTLGELLLRPSGGVGFQVSLEKGREHVMWWSPSPRWLYFVNLSFESPEPGAIRNPRPLPFRVGVVVKEGALGAEDLSGEEDGDGDGNGDGI